MTPAPAGSPYLRDSAEGVVLTLKVIPRSSITALAGIQAEALKLKVTAPPVDSAANAEVIRFLAEILDVPRGTVQLLRGATSRHKQVRVLGLSASRALQRLKPLLQSD
jgi:hypothetical protein